MRLFLALRPQIMSYKFSPNPSPPLSPCSAQHIHEVTPDSAQTRTNQTETNCVMPRTLLTPAGDHQYSEDKSPSHRFHINDKYKIYFEPGFMVKTSREHVCGGWRMIYNR